MKTVVLYNSDVYFVGNLRVRVILAFAFSDFQAALCRVILIQYYPSKNDTVNEIQKGNQQWKLSTTVRLRLLIKRFKNSDFGTYVYFSRLSLSILCLITITPLVFPIPKQKLGDLQCFWFPIKRLKYT